MLVDLIEKEPHWAQMMVLLMWKGKNSDQMTAYLTRKDLM